MMKGTRCINIAHKKAGGIAGILVYIISCIISVFMPPIIGRM